MLTDFGHFSDFNKNACFRETIIVTDKYYIFPESTFYGTCGVNEIILEKFNFQPDVHQF